MINFDKKTFLIAYYFQSFDLKIRKRVRDF